MAVKKKVVEIDTSKAERSLKSLRQELRAYQDELLNLDEGTEEYAQTMQKAADIKHELREQMEELNASAMDFGLIVGNTTKAIGGVIGGFQALTATMTLMGIENEDAIETMKKLQALMAMTQAISAIDDGIKAFKRLYNLIENSTAVAKIFNKTQKATAVTEAATAATTEVLGGAMKGEAAATTTATKATNTFKKALISTGIGAIVVLIGTLIAHLEDLARWLGFGSNEAEKQAEALLKLQTQYKFMNTVYQQYNTSLEGKQFLYKAELREMDKRIAKMKAQGATEAAIMAQQEKDNKRRKEILDDEVETLNKQLASIEKNYAKVMKSIVGNTYSSTLSMRNAHRELSDATMALSNSESELAKLENEDASKEKIARQKQIVEKDKQRLEILNQYIDSVNTELDLTNELEDREEDLSNERIQKRKELKESLLKFDNEILANGLKNKEKDLASIQTTEDEKLKTLKNFYNEGIISKTEYEARRAKIKSVYSQQRLETEYKYAEEESKKRSETLKKQFDFERKEIENERKIQKQNYDAEHQDLVYALNTRQISIVEYYNKEKDLAKRNYEANRTLLETEYNKEKTMLEGLLNEKLDLMFVEGISDEQRATLMAETNELSQQLLLLEAEHKNNLQSLATNLNDTITEMNVSTIETQMESLRILSANVVGAMDAITSTADGVSSRWASAFDIMSNGLINLTQKVKEGGAQWQDYAQLAVSAFAAAGEVMGALADEQDESTKEGFEQQKKYLIAATTMNMLGGIISAWTSAMNPSNAWMTIWGQLAMAASTTAMIMTTGIMQIQKIKQQQFDGSGAGASSPSGGAMANIIAPVQYTQDVQGASLESAVKDSKVYVTETDITNTQNKVSVAENEARY